MPLSRNPTGPLEGLSGFDSSGKVRLSPNDPDAPRLLALYPDRYVMTSAAQAAPYLATSSGSPLVGDLASLGYSASDIAALTAAQQQRGSAAPVTPAISTVSPGGGVTIGEYEDYRAVAEQALRSIGIVNADRFGFLSDADIDRFALAKMDVEAIAADYARRPEVQAINPGAELGLSREGYFTGREGHEEAYNHRFRHRVVRVRALADVRPSLRGSRAGCNSAQRRDLRSAAVSGCGRCRSRPRSALCLFA